MDTKLKFFVACCAIALTTIFSTEIVKAGPADDDQDDDQPTMPDGPKGGCVGDGACGITKNGTILIGKWREI